MLEGEVQMQSTCFVDYGADVTECDRAVEGLSSWCKRAIG